MFLWELAIKKGAGWIEFDEDFVGMMKDEGMDFPPKIQGEGQLATFLEDNQSIKEYLTNYIKVFLNYSNNNVYFF